MSKGKPQVMRLAYGLQLPLYPLPQLITGIVRYNRVLAAKLS